MSTAAKSLTQTSRLLRETTWRKADQVTISDSTVAIVGTGNIGSTLAANFAADGQDFLLAGRDQEAAGQILAGLLPPGARLVKAFGSLPAGSLSSAARRGAERAVVFYAADDGAAGGLVADLIRAGGFDPVRVGGLDSASAPGCPAACTSTVPWAGPWPDRRRWRRSDVVSLGAWPAS
jgi:predicted dinucleotide-binding enzyme